MSKQYDPKKITEKQIRRAQNATQDYVSGVENVSESPTAKAAKKKDKMRAGINAAIDSGKWEDGLMSVSLEQWKERTAKKGGERYASGVADSADRVEEFHAEFAPFMASVQAKIDQMPDTTAEQRIARMVANAQALAKFRRSRRRR